MKTKVFLILMVSFINITESSAIDLIIPSKEENSKGKPYATGTLTKVRVGNQDGKPILELSAEQYDQAQIISIQCNVTEQAAASFLGSSLKDLFFLLSESASTAINSQVSTDTPHMMKGLNVICDDRGKRRMVEDKTGRKIIFEAATVEPYYNQGPSIAVGSVRIGK